MEVGVDVPSMVLDFLSGRHLSLDLGGCLGVHACVRRAVVSVDVLRDSDGLDYTVNAVNRAIGVNFGQMYWLGLLNGMEVVVVTELHVSAGQHAAHDRLGELFVPNGAMCAGDIVGIHQVGGVVAWWLQQVKAFQLHGVQQALHDLLACINVD